MLPTVSESRLRWYDHVLRREEDFVGKKAMELSRKKKRTTQ